MKDLQSKAVFFQKQNKSFFVNDQRDAQIIFYVFISIYNSLHVSSTRAHHQERQIVSVQPMVTIILCW
jgi:hypothetical protein